ncbi:DUF4179 domain-containing protein [Sporosarcina sp. ACRSL]|uniref:DUF4179 domain-containing protein n=1 Tax=Sporosarcina sp. ACRSL TaxID=2918215 RepID=UPI001EF6DD7E|nr:DUF4179 domain-containing protein [Sporosarcina sp. ACRSL]MCG7343235.1 DUF4179 domain-containing protein [Sporosarcina sp. ACRSL]
MNCPTADKLSQFVDQMLPKQEMAEIEAHVQSCTSCGRVVNAFQEEQHFIEETLQTPTLPENFTDLVLDQLEPYGKARNYRRKAAWKRVGIAAAGIVLAVGIGATVNPSFAQFIGGLFSTDQVDEGLNLAAEAGLIQRVDLQVEDQGLTFFVEDVIADSSRVTLSYKVLNKNGKPQDTYLDIADSNNTITAIDQNGNVLDRLGTSWQHGSDYGYIEFSLRDQDNVEELTIQFNLVELNGVKGNWKLQVPVDLHENRKLTKMADLKDATAVHHGVEIDLKKLQMAPSSMELYFETAFTKEEREKTEEAIREFEEKFGKSSLDNLVFGNNSAIEYHIENAEGKVIYSTARDTNSDTAGMLQGSGDDLNMSGGTAWIHSFVPKNEEQLTFVLNGVYKKEPTDLSLTIKPKDIKKHPVSFDYKGTHLTIKSVKKPLFGKERSVVIKMEGGTDSLDADLGNWIAVDGEGNSYLANFGSSILDEKDKNGRHIATLDLRLDSLEEVPEELTLYLVSMTSYYPVEEQWRVPLLGE